MSKTVGIDIEKITKVLTALSKQQWLSVRGRQCAVQLEKELQDMAEETAAFAKFVQQQDMGGESCA